MMRSWAVTPLMLGLLGGAVARGEETVESIEKKLDAAAEKIATLSYTIEQRSEVDAGGIKQKSFTKTTVDTRRKGKDDLFKAQSRTETNVGDQKGTQLLQCAFDGKALWFYSEEGENKIAFKQPPNPESPMYPRGATMLAEYKTGFELKVLPPEKVDGKEMILLESTNKESSPPPGVAKKRKIWIDLEVGLIRKVVELDAAGKEFGERAYRDIKPNPTLPDDAFTLKLPEGVTLLDLTSIGGDAKPPAPAPAPKK